MRVLVTGGAGFIGSHVAAALLSQDHEVFVLDDLSRGWKENVPHGARLHIADIRSPESKRLIEDLQPDAIFHHAAQIDVQLSVADPVLNADINVNGTVRLANAAARCGATLFVLASSGPAIYGEQETFPAAEDHSTKANSPYGISKRCCELYLEYFSKRSGMRAVFLRYANVYGPRQDPQGGAGVVSVFTERMLKNEPIVVFGDGEQTRDYVYVEDVARANVLVAEKSCATGPYNLGTGDETSVNALAKFLATESHYTGDIGHGPAKSGEPRRSVLDSKRAFNELGWRPQFTLQEGLKRTVAWYGEHLKRARATKRR